MDEWLTTARCELLAKVIYTKGILQWGQHTDLKHHRADKTAKDPSPFYFNFRPQNPLSGKKPGPLTGRLSEIIGACMKDLVVGEALPFTCVAGIPTGGTMLAESFSLRLLYSGHDLEHLLTLKKDDNGFIVSGERGMGRKIILVDDVLTSGASALEAIRALEACGYEVEATLFVVNRSQGGEKNICKHYSTPVCWLFTAPWLFTYYYQQGWIEEDRHHEAIEYIKNNQLTL